MLGLLIMIFYIIFVICLGLTRETIQIWQKPILSHQEFERIFKREITTLNLDKLKINFVCVDNIKDYAYVYCWKQRNDSYNHTVVFHQPQGFQTIIIKHELFHVYRGHCVASFLFGKKIADLQAPFFIKEFLMLLWVFRQHFWHEPQANLYAVFGLKL